MKICKKCGIEQDESCFSKDAHGLNGLKSRCKQCISEYDKKMRYKTGEKKREAAKKWNKEHPEKHSAYEMKRYYKDRSTFLEKHKQWVAKNIDKWKKYHKEYKLKNPDKYKNQGERFFVTFVLKPIILERDNYACQLCGINKDLQLHHILPVKNDDTEQHISNPRNMVILCKECHLKAHDGHYKRLNMTLAKNLLELVKAKEKINKTVLPEYKSKTAQKIESETNKTILTLREIK